MSRLEEMTMGMSEEFKEDIRRRRDCPAAKHHSSIICWCAIFGDDPLPEDNVTQRRVFVRKNDNDFYFDATVDNATSPDHQLQMANDVLHPTHLTVSGFGGVSEAVLNKTRPESKMPHLAAYGAYYLGKGNICGFFLEPYQRIPPGPPSVAMPSFPPRAPDSTQNIYTPLLALPVELNSGSTNTYAPRPPQPPSSKHQQAPYSGIRWLGKVYKTPVICGTFWTTLS